MTSFKVPAGESRIEHIEKKSRFIGYLIPVQTPEEAAEKLKQLKKEYWDATHVVHAYVLENGVMRFSDDGEPQGTAGLPTLEVLKKEAVFNAMAVTVRYFGGILLGAGGLTRTYGKCAKLALDQAGIAEMRPFAVTELRCPYGLLEILRTRYDRWGAWEEITEFGAEVQLTVLLPAEQADGFTADITEVSCGRVIPRTTGEKLFAKKLG